MSSSKSVPEIEAARGSIIQLCQPNNAPAYLDLGSWKVTKSVLLRFNNFIVININI